MLEAKVNILKKSEKNLHSSCVVENENYKQTSHPGLACFQR